MLAASWAAVLAAGGCASVSASVGLDEPGRAESLAPGVYVVRGALGEVGPANRGRTGNLGFIVGLQGVLVIDCGVSRRHGEALLAEIARITPLPVRRVIVTHARQEFLFGAAAFQARGIPVHMHRRTADLMAARCGGCLKTLQQVLGTDEMQGTTMFKADAVFDASHALALIGRPVEVMHLGHSSGPGDLAIYDPVGGVLFGAGLVSQGVIPDVQDALFSGWTDALARLQALPLSRVVPGHGAPGDAGLLAQVGRYLAQLEARVGELLARGTALSEVADLAELPEFRTWDQYDTIHRRNASMVYLRLEREALFK